MNKSFGEYLYALRTERGWTQQQLADLLGVTNKTVSKWERNDGYPNIDTLLSLAKLLNVTVDELLKGGNSSNQENSMEVLLREWNSKKISMIAHMILFVGLLVFLSIYFMWHKFEISFFVFLIFALISGGLLMYKQEKLYHLLKQEKNKKEILVWLCYLGICLVMLLPCSLGLFVTYTIVEGVEVNVYLTFADYLTTWLPLSLALAAILLMIVRILQEDSFLQVKKKLKQIFVVGIGLVVAFVIFTGLLPKFQSYENYSQLKANYYSFVRTYNGVALKPEVMNPYFAGSQAYEKYVDVIGFIDLTNMFVYRRTVQDWPTLLNGAKWGFIVSIVVSGCYLFHKKKENNVENEDV